LPDRSPQRNRWQQHSTTNTQRFINIWERKPNMRLHQRIISASGAVGAIAAAVLCLLVAAAPAHAGEGKTVNVNTATAAEFQLLPRIGPSVAARLVEQREKNGPWKTLDDLMLVRGIGESTYEQLKPYVALSGPTTLTEKVKLPRAPKGATGSAAPSAPADNRADKS
jgi:competence protein ComEA